MKTYIIGIDTGGTFTDGVLLEKESKRIVQAAKVPTTHHQLSLGIAGVLSRLTAHSDIPAEAMEGVAISSTLATNAVVENKGARVAVFVIGYVKHFRLPVKATLYLKGGHSITGNEEEALDLDYLVSLLGNLKSEVDAYGVCSAMSFKNPAHELVVEKAIEMIDPKPVFCSHRISELAGMEERAATAGLHAKLMPLMEEFIDGVEQAVRAANIAAPLHIVGGNGKVIDAEIAISHAGMTVASGPACTAMFGVRHEPGEALVIDVGGTTTDITMIEGGRPLLTPQGCHIGDWRTHVEAIDMHTKGIGGDSLVEVGLKRTVKIGPRRVSPVATSACPAGAEDWLGPKDRSKCIELIGKPESDESHVVASALLDHGPSTMARLKEITGLNTIPLEKQLENLNRRQLIRETGFTPTDALETLGLTEFGDRKKAQKAAQVLGRQVGLSAEDFAMMVIEKTVDAIESSVLEYITARYWQTSLNAFLTARNSHPVLGVNFSLKIPIIGIGAAARYFLPQVAERFHTTVYFPDHFEIGNAVGAAFILAESVS